MSQLKATYVDHMGNDESVVNAARVSFDKDASCYSDAQNENLIYFLARGMSSKDHKALINKLAAGTGNVEEAIELLRMIQDEDTHWTPFAHTAITLRCSAPVPIRTQCFKHKQGMVENEESRRYISCRPELYIPESFRAKPDGSIKQGSGTVHEDSDKWLEIYTVRCKEAIDEYMQMIEAGVCPEQARFILPQGVLVNWIWTGNLYGFANFVKKRSNSHAQKEIQGFAKEVSDIIKDLYPISWKALTGC
ncbi:FAD-dependent thymidylate synthase [Acinetobacter baumannii]|uniref:FAD-dependent thymidylate synthase n=1 Tax=Acinetobacter baumannii TaxID=470 RepID=UPI0026E04D19|nr:FAD-dependent thymidylate synthase [Acinetobacter baumannii]MDO5926375.1 FAD-dependent thymidylate synthase [Acinetobacter baumannii]